MDQNTKAQGDSTRSSRRHTGRSRGGKGGAEARSTIRERERRVLTLSEQGWTQEAIAEDLGITQAAVSKIVRRVDDRALQVIAAERAHFKMRRARHLEYLSREGRRGWEQSKQGHIRRRQRKAAGADGTPVVTQDVVIDEHPDPRMLDQARKAEETLVDMFGCTAPAADRAPSDVTADPTLPILFHLSTDTLERALADLTVPRDPQTDAE